MNKRRTLSMLLAVGIAASLMTSCSGSTAGGGPSGEHEVITIQCPFRDMGPFVDLVKEKYPEINLEVIPYSGKNTTAYTAAQLKAGDMPDIYTTTIYVPGQMDLSDKLIDLSSYGFTNNYSEDRLRDVADESGAIYMLPTFFTCIGITYNKTLLEENGWELPTTFEELEELAPKVEAAGYDLALDQIALPGYGFQYLCNILDTVYFNTLEGRAWLKAFLNGETTVRDDPKMMEALATLEKWRDIGMLNGNGDPEADSVTKDTMAEGKTLFMLGNENIFRESDSDCEFGLIPYLSDDGTQNSLVLNVSRFVGLNKHLEDAGNEQKLQDAVHVIDVLSTVEGLTSLNATYSDTSLLPLKDYVIPETSYYKQVEDELNAGLTAPFIYSGWENLIVPIGNTVLDYIKGNATLDDVIDAFDENQHLLTDNSPAIYTTVNEKIDTDDCARLVGICFARASGADLALISKNKWYREDVETDLNSAGVSGALFALPVTDQEITTILPTGWRGNIETVSLTGKRIKELVEFGYDRSGSGNTFPYELVTPEGMTIDDDTTYTAVICGVTDDVAEEGDLTDTGILGLTAAEEYLGQFETLSRKDIRWE